MPQMHEIRSTIRGQLAWNTGAQLIARGVSALTTFIITIVVARTFGVVGFGDFVKITTYVAFFYLLADFGFNAIYLQRTPPSDSHESISHDSVWENLLALRLIISSLFVLMASALLWILPQGSVQGYTGFVRMGILLFAPSIVFQALTTTGNALFQKYLRYDLSAIAVSAGSLVSVILIFFVIYTSFGGTSLLWATTSILIGTAVTAATSLFLTRKLQRVAHTAISWGAIRSLFWASFPLGLTLLFNLVYFRVDSIILTLTRSTTEVGVYGLAYKIFELPLVIPTFFMNALYPVMLGTGIRQQRGNPFRRLIVRSATLLLIVSCLMVLVLWVGAPVISFIRPDFASGIGALRILSLGLPFFFLSSLTMWTLIAKKQQKLLAVLYGTSMIINVVLNILFIPHHGYMAAAWITVFCEGVVLLLSGIFVFPLILNEK